MAEVHIQFDESAIRLLADPNHNPALAALMDRVAGELVNAVKREAPVSPVASGHSGHLRSSVHAFRQPDGSILIGPVADYAKYVIGGTEPHLIRSHGDYSLHSRVTGRYFGRTVRHPGTRPNGFVERALERVAAEHL